MSGRGVLTVADLKARCDVDPVSHCWNWRGAYTVGQPRVWTLDHERIEKRAMSGAKAAWNIAHGEAPPQWALVFRRCCNVRCLNPVHLGLAASKREIGEHHKRNGGRKGTHVEVRRKNLERAREVAGIQTTPAEKVAAIRRADRSVSNLALARQLGMAHQTVSRIRRGETHREVQC